MQRPTGVTILAVLCFIGAAGCVIFALFFFIGGAAMSSMGGPMAGGMLAALGAFAGIFFLIVGLIDGVIGFGLMKLQNWARIITIVLVALGLLSAAFSATRMLSPMNAVGLVSQLIAIAIDVWIILYLLKPHVKQAFGAS